MFLNVLVQVVDVVGEQHEVIGVDRDAGLEVRLEYGPGEPGHAHVAPLLAPRIDCPERPPQTELAGTDRALELRQGSAERQRETEPKPQLTVSL